jgi:hypothetical protein
MSVDNVPCLYACKVTVGSTIKGYIVLNRFVLATLGSRMTKGMSL